MKRYRCLSLFASVLLIAQIGAATVFEKITDAQLADRSDVIVVGTVQDAVSREAEDGRIVTDYHLVVEDVRKGTVPGVLTITEVGGIIGSRFTFIADSAVYEPGERVVAFLRRRDDGTFFTTSMAHGKVTLSAEPKLHIVANGNAKNYALFFAGLPVRWPTSNVAFKVSGSMPFPAANGINNAMAAWSNDPAANIHLSNAGNSAVAAPEPSGANDGENTIFLSYDAAVSGFCDGAQGCTIIRGDTAVTHTFDGDTWISIQDVDIVIRSAVGAAQFTALMTHEMGHAIGIRHSDQGTPSDSAAIMASTVPAIYGSTLQQWDKDAVDSLYGSGPVCRPPQITSVIGGGTVPSGSTARLTANTTGSAPLNYQWYDGLAGDTSTPVGTNSAIFTTPPITTTKNYWVHVTNSCGAADSTTVTVIPQACQKPAITIDPQSQTIASGGTATLTVGNSGTGPFTYQWYQGQSGDTSTPVGPNASQFTTPNLTQTTSYWVRVSNSCGSADSRAATITIPGSCTTPSFTIQPGNVTLDAGQQTFLAASASDATSYQWFKGTAGDESTPLIGTNPSNARFVNQLYIDVLRRQADPGANALISQLDSNSLTRLQVAQIVLGSAEYRTNLIADYYNAYLHRAPDPAAIAFWLPAFGAGITDEQFAAQILGSPEYFALAGSTNSLWLSHAFNDVLGRSPDPAATTFFLGVLGSGGSRTTVALSILTSAEDETRLVQSWFSRFLRRPGAAPEVAAFVSALGGGAKDEQIMATILAADAYFNFGTVLPTGPLSSTTSFWVKAINSNGNCSTNSATATVTIRACSPPSIATQPQNATVITGDSATFAVVATNATGYQWYQGASGDVTTPVSGATGPVLVTAPLFTVGNVQFWVKVTNSCGSTNSAAATATVTCGAPKPPTIKAPPSHNAQNSFIVSWTGDIRLSSKYDLQEATKNDFSDATTFTITDGSLSKTLSHSGITSDTRYFYRVRAYAICNGAVGSFSTSANTLVTAPPPPTAPLLNHASAPCPTGQLTCTIIGNLTGIFIRSGKTALDTTTYAVTADKPWITFSPPTGPVPDDGKVNVQYTIDLTQLGIGSTDATVTFTYSTGSGKTALGGTTQTVPVSVSLVTPVTQQPKDGTAPPNTVLVPAVAHADGINSQFQSDVRITNTAPQPITYLLTYTPSNTDGTQSGKQSSITVDSGETKALNDIVKNWYGSGSLGEAGVGTLEIRPLNYAGKTGVNVSFATVASSRTYNTTANGTFGQYIPAIPLIDFLAKSDISRISLQQVAQSSAFRTNLGFVEGSGQPVDFAVSLMDDKSNVIATRPYSLRPFEHQQISLAGFFPGVSITDGRLEVQVTSDTGKLTAYASVLDNVTSDPLLVFPVDPSQVTARRFVVPGVAEFSSPVSNFHTDMRIFNGSSSPTTVTLTFPANAALQAVQKQLAAKEVWAIDNVLPTLWNTTGGGAVVTTTDNDAPLVVTARTYSRRDDGGTFGQFIPGVTAADGVGVGDRPLQIVQLEQSPAFRSNLGLVEVTGNPVTLDVAAYTPDSKIAAHTQVTLAPGQFTQLGSVFAGMGFKSNVYNGRIAVTAIDGTGRAAAYGSVVDNRTLDPTYVPAK